MLLKILENLYKKYNKRRFVHPDPLEFLYNYSSLKDREVCGLIASSLAYGRVENILKSVGYVLKTIGRPANLKDITDNRLSRLFSDFKYRFTTSKDLILFLSAIRTLLRRNGSLYHCFLDGYRKQEESIYPSLLSFMKKMYNITGKNSLIPIPEAGSPFKRINLFLRWMVRKDNVDPGGWDEIEKSKIIVPLDIHLYRFAKSYEFTARKQADIKTAIEITNCFKVLCPSDPVRYDFVITRLGMWGKQKEIADSR
jgi:uncharacterized protein (TIGR02757 family)